MAGYPGSKVDQIGRPGYVGPVKCVNIAEAKAHLSELVERAAHGEEIVLARSGRPRAKLVAWQPPRAERKMPSRPRGRFRVREGFDAPLPESVLRLFEGKVRR
ncbi:type II toxin-antitoxin system prevent-host-death family antitoxin [Candidatus Binatia bacterium]|nr:type II toxin-antitoxin system prevent-host-death family antitoxin [Candidatus Binatia bacterium]